MVPPGKITYYFTVDGGDGQIADNQPCEPSQSDQFELTIPKVNYIDKITKSNVKIATNFIDTLNVLPRAEPRMLRGLKRVKTPWDFMKSVFAKYKPDTDLLVSQCFLFDWEKTRLDKLLKNDSSNLLAVKDYVMRNYSYLRNVYKVYSGESV